MADGRSIAMLGTGLIGDFYTMTLHGQRGRDRVAVAYSRSEERGKAFRERWDIPRSTTSMAEAINDDEVDVVVIGLPNFLHEESIGRLLVDRQGPGIECERRLFDRVLRERHEPDRPAQGMPGEKDRSRACAIRGTRTGARQDREQPGRRGDDERCPTHRSAPCSSTTSASVSITAAYRNLLFRDHETCRAIIVGRVPKSVICFSAINR